MSAPGEDCCAGCQQKFKKLSFHRKHNCSNCDQLFCENCSKKVTLAGNQAVRVCNSCHAKLGADGQRSRASSGITMFGKKTLERGIAKTPTAAQSTTPIVQPEEAEVNVLFEAFMEEEGFGDAAREKMRLQPLSTKWILLQQASAKDKDKDKNKDQPSYWTKILDVTPPGQVTKELLVGLRDVMKFKGTKSWIVQFHAEGGLQALFGILESHTAPGVKQEALTCLSWFMKHKVGFQHVIQHPIGAEILVGMLKKDENSTADRVAVLNMLSAIVLDESMGDAGWQAVVRAFKQNFKILVNFCQSPVECPNPKCDANLPTYALSCYDCNIEIGFELITAALTLINLIIQCEKDVDVRITMRRSMDSHGLIKIIARIQQYCTKIPELKSQCDLFDTLWKEDNREMMWNALDGKKVINLGDIDMLFTAVRDSALEDGEIGRLIEVLRNFLVIRSDQAKLAWPLVADMVYAAVTGIRDAPSGTRMDVADLKRLLDEKSGGGTSLTLGSGDGADVSRLNSRIRALENELAAKSAELNHVLQNPPTAQGGTSAPSFTGGPPPPPGSPEEGGGAPEAPSFGAPDAPDFAGAPPGAPEAPGFSDAPDAPGAPEAPGAPGAPDAPDFGDIPGAPPGPPGPPGAPGAPSVPGKHKIGAPAGPVVNLPPKREFKPNAKMKQLHWTTVPPVEVEGSIWHKLSDDKVQFDFKAFEGFFSEKVREEKAPSATLSPRKTEDTKERLLEPVRGQNVTIAATRLRMSYAEVRTAILECDEDKLTEEKLTCLVAIAPTPEEVEMIRESPTPMSNLGEAEQFFKVISDIPRLGTRLELVLFKKQFPESHRELNRKIECLLAAQTGLLESTSFKRVLEIVLAFGNYLNAGTKKGGVYGFKLATLTKLKLTRSQDNKHTLVDFLLQTIQSQDNTLDNFVNDLAALEPASKLELKMVAAEGGKLSGTLGKLKSALAAPAGKDDKFQEKMGEFYTQALHQTNASMIKVEELKTNATKIAKMFGEDANTSFEQICSTVGEFVFDYLKAKEDQMRKKEEEDKETKRLALKAQLASAMAAKNSGRGEGERKDTDPVVNFHLGDKTPKTPVGRSQIDSVAPLLASPSNEKGGEGEEGADVALAAFKGKDFGGMKAMLAQRRERFRQAQPK